MYINKSECGFTYYRYYIKGIHSGASNYIPIFAIKIPYTYESVRTEQINIYSVALADFGIKNSAEAFWKYVPRGGIPTSFLEIYEDDFFTIYTPNTSDLSCSFKDSDGTKLGRTRTSGCYNVSENVISIYGIVVITSDNEVIYGSGNIAASDYDFLYCRAIQGNNSVDIIHKPISEKSKGIAVYPSYNVSVDARNNKQSFKKRIHELLKISRKISTNPDDPYKHVGDDPDDPPDGDFDYNSDDVTVPDLPQTSVTDSGLVTLFAPSNEQLKSLARYLWSDAFSLDSFKKLFNNPMDCILGLSILPIHLPHGSAKEITVGNVISTVSCDVCSRQYVKLNCGTFTMSRNAFTGGYLDYSPYTKAYLYLPFIGSQQIDIDEFMNTTIGVEYHIDILTGAMFCYVTRNNKLILTYSGNCAENVPLSANDFTSTISSMVSIAAVGAGAVATIATAGAAAPALAGAGEAALGARTASSLIGAGATGAGAVMNSKPSVQHSGSLGGGAGAMGCLYPYILFVAPRISLPENQNQYTGFPSNKVVKIGSLSGFNVVEAVNLSVKGATDAEVSEIEAVLRNGVII